MHPLWDTHAGTDFLLADLTVLTARDALLCRVSVRTLCKVHAFAGPG